MRIFKLFLLFILLQILSCSSDNKITVLVETKNSTESTNEIKIHESKNGFEIEINEAFRKNILDKKVKKMFLINENKKIEISLFNIFYSSKDNVKYQTPMTPKGGIAIFKSDNGYFIDIKTDNKKDFYQFMR